ncbi:hypothetical protein UFOVP374_18 [uncultured Caudovirales phage]|uniref:Uncharacterized protein n=1 Tax=uncultured Caudovirales phage TaxID=2100421 RepID=A0A6J7WWX6_9CAUD|nr:hypothetical protein UFOVP374_18 [uncultured Caudovirales phage]
MAELNFGILDTQAPGRIAAMPQQREEQQAKNAMQLMQVQQAMGQNELAKYQLSSARRTDEETNKLRALYGEASDISDPNFIRKVYAINPEKGIALDKAIAERTAKKLTQTETEGKIQAQKYKFFVDRLSSLSQDPSDAGIDRFLKEAVDGGVMSFDLASAKSAQLKGMGLPERQKAILGAGQSAKDALAALKPDIKEFSGGLYNVNEVDPNTGMPRFLSPRVALPSTDAALRSANAAGMKWNTETLQFENVGGGAPAQSGVAPAPRTPGAAPAQAGAPVTPATFPRDTAVQQTTRMTDATAIKRQELANEQIKLANATQKLASPAAAKDPDIRKFYEDQAKQATNNIASLNQELGGRTNNMPGAAAAAPTVNAMNAPSPREIREARAKGYAFNPDGTMSRISGGPADKTVVTRTPVQEVKFRKDLATDYTMVTATAQATQDLIDSITDVKNSPGLAGATGISGMVYSFPGSQAAAAQTNLANLKGKVTLLGKALASVEGKIGPMAVQEWTIVREMVAALDTAVSKGEKITLDEIDKIEFAAKNVAKRVQDKFEGQYGDELSNYPQFATVPEPKSRLSGKIKPAGGGSVTAPKTPTVNIDALLKKYE